MHFERLTDLSDARFAAAHALYKESFPIYEQRTKVQQKRALENEAYHYNLIYDGGEFVGLMLTWESETFCYIEHFCILKEKRGLGCGSRALALLKKEQGEKKLILEIDPPKDAVSKRRKAFYERSGFSACTFSHVHPPYRKAYAGHALEVLSSPRTLKQAEYEEFNRYLKTTVMEIEEI